MYIIITPIGPSGTRSEFRGRCGYPGQLQATTKKGQKRAFFGGPRGDPKNGLFWPFLGVMSGQVHLILAFFEKNMSLIRGGTHPGGGTPQDLVFGGLFGPPPS